MGYRPFTRNNKKWISRKKREEFQRDDSLRISVRKEEGGSHGALLHALKKLKEKTQWYSKNLEKRRRRHLKIKS